MAFYLPNCRMADIGEAMTAPGAVILAESQALVVAAGGMSAGVMPSTGTASDIFVGFAIAGTSALPFPEAYVNKVEQFVVPTGGVITLSLTPVSGQVFIADNTLGTFPAVTLSGASLSGLTVGDTVTVTYKYAMSVVQERALYGDVQPGGYVGSYVGQIGMVTRGDVWITEFDASKNWALAGSTGNSVVLAANGQLTLGTPGAAGVAPIAVPNCIITGIPNQTLPFLGLRFSAA